jgi:hypothetical protein
MACVATVSPRCDEVRYFGTVKMANPDRLFDSLIAVRPPQLADQKMTEITRTQLAFRGGGP